MAIETLKQYMVEVGAKMDKAAFGSMSKQLASTLKGLTALSVAFTGASIAGFKFMSSVSKDADQLGDFAANVGIAAKDLDALQYAATIAGSSSEAMAQSIATLNRNIGDAMAGRGRVVNVWKEMGVAFKDASGKALDAQTVMENIRKRASKLGSRGEQTSLITRSGFDQSMVEPLLGDKLSAPLADYAKAWRAAGGDMDKVAEIAGDFTDRLDQIKLRVNALKGTAFEKSGKAWIKTLETMRDTIEQLSGFMARNLARALASIARGLTGLTMLMRNTATAIADITRPAREAFGRWLSSETGQRIERLISTFGPLVLGLGAIATAIGGATVAMRALNIAAWINPFSLAAAAVLSLGAAFAALLDDYRGWTQGADSLFDWSGFQKGLEAAAEKLEPLLGGLADSFKQLFSELDVLKDFAAFLQGAGKLAFDSFVEILNGVVGVLKDMVGWIVKAQDSAAAFFSWFTDKNANAVANGVDTSGKSNPMYAQAALARGVSTSANAPRASASGNTFDATTNIYLQGDAASPRTLQQVGRAAEQGALKASENSNWMGGRNQASPAYGY